MESFAINVKMKEEVKEYILSFLIEKVIQNAFNGKEVKDIVEAKKIIEEVFLHIETEYSSKIPKEVTNENI